MAQKSNPTVLRLKYNHKGWLSAWCRNYKEWVAEDYRVREYLNARLSKANVAQIYIERTSKFLISTIFAQRPALIIGKGGKEVEVLKGELKKITKKDVQINILEVKRPELEAILVAKSVANQIQNRISYKKAIKLAISSALRMNAEGIKITISGRLNGAEMARSESFREGRVPLSTFRADIDYAFAEARTTYGLIGIKVWIMKGEIYGKRELSILSRLAYKKQKKSRIPLKGKKYDTN